MTNVLILNAKVKKNNESSCIFLQFFIKFIKLGGNVITFK